MDHGPAARRTRIRAKTDPALTGSCVSLSIYVVVESVCTLAVLHIADDTGIESGHVPACASGLEPYRSRGSFVSLLQALTSEVLGLGVLMQFCRCCTASPSVHRLIISECRDLK